MLLAGAIVAPCRRISTLDSGCASHSGLDFILHIVKRFLRGVGIVKSNIISAGDSDA